MSNRHKRKGQSKFLLIDGYIFRSLAWRALSAIDRAAYLEIKWRYDGKNNGRIGLGNRELAEALHSSKDTARRCFDSLIEKGFLAKEKASGFNVKSRAATEWRLTEYPSDLTGELASKDFMRWSPAKNPQAHQKDIQAHQKDSQHVSTGENGPHRRTRGTVTAIPTLSQAHQKDTYSITRQGVA